jgi:CrcB protein
VTVLLVLGGGACGAVLRYAVGRLALTRPAWGTFAVNVAGSLLLGALAGLGAALPGWVGSLLGVGFCGALTTWSTFAYETVTLPRRWAVAYAAGTLVAGLSAAFVGAWLDG